MPVPCLAPGVSSPGFARNFGCPGFPSVKERCRSQTTHPCSQQIRFPLVTADSARARRLDMDKAGDKGWQFQKAMESCALGAWIPWEGLRSALECLSSPESYFGGRACPALAFGLRNSPELFFLLPIIEGNKGENHTWKFGNLLQENGNSPCGCANPLHKGKGMRRGEDARLGKGIGNRKCIFGAFWVQSSYKQWQNPCWVF